MVMVYIDGLMDHLIKDIFIKIINMVKVLSLIKMANHQLYNGIMANLLVRHKLIIIINPNIIVNNKFHFH